MKILFVIPSVGLTYGGTSKIALELAQSLGKNGCELDLVTTNTNGLKNLDVLLQTWIQEPNYRIRYFPCLRISDYKFSITLAQWLIKNIDQYDIVHTIAVFSPLVSFTHWLCFLRKVPFVSNPQGMLEPWALANKSIKKKIYYNFFEFLPLNGASAIHILSSSEASEIKKLDLKAKLVIVPNGIYQHEFELQSNPKLFHKKFPHLQGKPLILFMGRIDPKKGLDLLAPAFAQVRQQFPESHLVIAGPDNIGYLPTAQKLFQDSGCPDAVTFTGMITGDLKYSALAAASVYVAPSYSEGFSMSILEGMASGLPCVFTDACNFPEAFNVAKIVPVDRQQIANALTWCLGNPEEAKEMGNQAREFILENYTWDKIATKMITIYRSILKSA